jgi:hypothetical protein
MRFVFKVPLHYLHFLLSDPLLHEEVEAAKLPKNEKKDLKIRYTAPSLKVSAEYTGA